MLVDGPQVEEALLGADGATTATGRAAVRRHVDDRPRRRPGALGERIEAFVDAPVTGSSPKAEDGTLTIMAGGAEERRRAAPGRCSRRWAS